VGGRKVVGVAAVVVVDDDVIIRDVVSRILEMAGHTVLSFEDARPALDGVDFSKIDLGGIFKSCGW